MSRKWLAVAAKAAVSALLIWFLLDRIDVADVIDRARRLGVTDAALCLAILLVQVLVVTHRWALVGRSIDAPLHLRTAFRILLIGMFFNQTLPSSVGGDAVRVWLLTREKMSTGKAISLVLCDRVLGLVVLIALIFLMLPVMSGRISSDAATRTTLAAIGIIGAIGFVVFLLAGNPLIALLRHWKVTRPLAGLATDFRRLFLNTGTTAQLLLLSLVVHLLTVAAVILLAWGIDVDVGILECILIVPAVILVTTLPISIAGWGVRESAMVAGLGLIGVASSDALAVSVLFGLVQIIVALPGGLVWLADRPRSAKLPRDDG